MCVVIKTCSEILGHKLTVKALYECDTPRVAFVKSVLKQA